MAGDFQDWATNGARHHSLGSLGVGLGGSEGAAACEEASSPTERPGVTTPDADPLSPVDRR